MCSAVPVPFSVSSAADDNNPRPALCLNFDPVMMMIDPGRRLLTSDDEDDEERNLDLLIANVFTAGSP